MPIPLRHRDPKEHEGSSKLTTLNRIDESIRRAKYDLVKTLFVIRKNKMNACLAKKYTNAYT